MMIYRSRSMLLLGGSVLASMTLSGAVLAQAAAPNTTTVNAATPKVAETKTDDSGGLDEIIITAQRVETKLQQTPIAVTAVSGAELRARGAVSLLDLQNFTPGLQVGSRGGQGAQQGGFSIRGIGVDATASSPAVGIYVDEVYYPSGAGNLLGLFDVARVEVLRGPQGTLFGRNTIAGAIQYITVQPGREFSGFIEGTLGNYDRRDVSAALTVPLGDTLSTRVAFSRTERDGFVYDELNDIHRGSDKITQGTAKLRWTPSDRLTVDLKGDYLEQSNNGRAIAIQMVNRNAQFVQIATNPFALGPFAYTGPFDDRFLSTRKYQIAGFNGQDSFNYKYYAGQGTIRYEISDAVTVKSITAYNRSRQRSVVDFDGTPAAIVEVNGGNPQTIDLFTQELQISGHSFSRRLHWTAGFYYYHSKDVDENRGILLGNLPRSAFQLTNGSNELKNDAKAGYAQGTYDFTDRVALVAGVRYSEEKVDGTNRSFPRPPLSTKFSNVSPLVGLNFQATPDLLFYAKASRGFRAGGFAISNALASGFVAFDPETAWTYEVGSRMEFFDRRLRINPTIFYTDWKSIQFNQLLFGTTAGGTPTTVVATSNAGDAHIYGAELEAQFAATDRLLFLASASTTNGKYTRIEPGLSLTKDSDLQRAPKFKYSVGARYTYPLPRESSVSASLDWSRTSRQRSATTDSNSLEVPSYGLLNARVQYVLPGGKFSIAGFATNLTNEYYFIGGTFTALAAVVGTSEADLARPREFGVTLRAAF